MADIDPANINTTDLNEWNHQIIDEFRANEGKVGGHFEGAAMLLLHTVGAKSGEPRVNPLVYRQLDGGYALFASYAGAPKSPGWYHNLLAQPEVTIEVGTDTVPVTARVTQDAERTSIWEKQKHDFPQFAAYEAKTDREIPVIVLEPTR